MLLLNTKYICSNSFEKDDFNAFIFDWIVNTKDKRYFMDIEEKEKTPYLTYQYQRKTLSFVDYSDMGILAAFHTDTDLEGIEWKLSIVFKYESHELFIQMSNSETTETGKFLRKFRKPDLIDELVDLKVIRKDGDIKILYEPHYIYENNVNEIESILEDTCKYNLPIIYLSTTPYGYYSMDPEVLADKYAGMAHVFAQYDPNVSKILENKYGYKVPHKGAIAIYFPIKSLDTNMFPFGKKSEHSISDGISKALCFFYKSQNYGPMTSYDEISRVVITARNRNLISENLDITKENKKVYEENESIVRTFDLDLKKTDAENQKLKEKIRDLEIENNILKQRLENQNKKPILFYGKEKDYFPNEIKEILLDVLKNTSIQRGTRRSDIIVDILESNDIETTLYDRQDEIKSILNDYREITMEKINRLEKLGFTITSDGKHHKLQYHDDRYVITISKTPSDIKSGKQAVSFIINKVF